MKTKNPILIQLGRNVRTLREQLGLSQEELAFRSGLDRTYVGGVERGERNIGVLNIVRVALALEVSPSMLVQGLEIHQEEQADT